MKSFLVFTIVILGFMAVAPNESPAQGFTVTFGDGPEYYTPGYYGYHYYHFDPGKEYYYYHRRIYNPGSYYRGYYYGPDHRPYRWYQ